MQKLAAIFLTSDKPHYPYELPKGWVWCKLEDYVFTVTDGDHQAPPKVSKGIPFLVISNIADGSLDFSNTRYVPEEYYEKIQMERKPKRGDILFSVTGSYGIVVNVKTDRQFCFQRHIGLIKPTISNEYLSFVLMSNYIKSLCDKLATGTAQKTVGLDTLRSLYVPIAPIEEQERIVTKIKHLLLQISFLEAGKGKLVAAIKQAKSKILDLAIHGKLVPQDSNDEPASELLKRINPKAEIISDNGHYQKLPVGWTICRLKDISKIVTGSTPSKSNRGYYGGIFPFFKPADLDAGRYVYKATECLSEDGKKVSRVVPKGATAICCIGTIGKVGYLMYEGATNQQINCAIPSKVVDSVFLFYLCASPLFNDKLNSESSAVTISIVNKSKIEAISVPLPPLAEQKRIVSKIEEIFAQLEAIETAL